ncbi:unnamed protein product [Chrysoparadoxa australica]
MEAIPAAVPATPFLYKIPEGRESFLRSEENPSKGRKGVSSPVGPTKRPDPPKGPKPQLRFLDQNCLASPPKQQVPQEGSKKASEKVKVNSPEKENVQSSSQGERAYTRAHLDAVMAAARADFGASAAELRARLECAEGARESAVADMTVMAAEIRRERLVWVKEKAELGNTIKHREWELDNVRNQLEEALAHIQAEGEIHKHLPPSSPSALTDSFTGGGSYTYHHQSMGYEGSIDGVYGGGSGASVESSGVPRASWQQACSNSQASASATGAVDGAWPGSGADRSQVDALQRMLVDTKEEGNALRAEVERLRDIVRCLEFESLCASSTAADLESVMMRVAGLEAEAAAATAAQQVAEGRCTQAEKEKSCLQKQLETAQATIKIVEEMAGSCAEDASSAMSELREATAMRRELELWLGKSLAEVEALRKCYHVETNPLGTSHAQCGFGSGMENVPAAASADQDAPYASLPLPRPASFTQAVLASRPALGLPHRSSSFTAGSSVAPPESCDDQCVEEAQQCSAAPAIAMADSNSHAVTKVELLEAFDKLELGLKSSIEMSISDRGGAVENAARDNATLESARGAEGAGEMETSTDTCSRCDGSEMNCLQKERVRAARVVTLTQEATAFIGQHVAHLDEPRPRGSARQDQSEEVKSLCTLVETAIRHQKREIAQLQVTMPTIVHEGRDV